LDWAYIKFFSPDVRLYSDEIPVAIIILGIFVFLVSITGCCGAFAENKPILIVYFVILSILVIGQVTIMIVILVDRANTEITLDQAWQKAYDSRPSIIRDIEDEYSCCGLKNITDRAIPKGSPEACHNIFGYNRPCLDSLSHSYKKHRMTLGIWSFILAIIQILALISAYILIVFLPNTREREYQYLSEHDRLVRGHGGIGRRTEFGQPPKSYNVDQQSSSAYGST